MGVHINCERKRGPQRERSHGLRHPAVFAPSGFNAKKPELQRFPFSTTNLLVHGRESTPSVPAKPGPAAPERSWLSFCFWRLFFGGRAWLRDWLPSRRAAPLLDDFKPWPDVREDAPGALDRGRFPLLGGDEEDATGQAGSSTI